MMGTGKSNVGNALQRSLPFNFIDTDSLIEKTENTTISKLFETKGEAYFREKERHICETLPSLSKTIISTGGGIVLNTQNHAALKKSGLIVWLKASTSTICKRLQKDNTRPLLKKTNWEETVSKLNYERETLYKAVANLSIETDTKSPEDIAQFIVKQYNKTHEY